MSPLESPSQQARSAFGELSTMLKGTPSLAMMPRMYDPSCRRLAHYTTNLKRIDNSIGCSTIPLHRVLKNSLAPYERLFRRMSLEKVEEMCILWLVLSPTPRIDRRSSLVSRCRRCLNRKSLSLLWRLAAN
jgi:ribosomal protein L37E